MESVLNMLTLVLWPEFCINSNSMERHDFRFECKLPKSDRLWQTWRLLALANNMAAWLTHRGVTSTNTPVNEVSDTPVSVLNLG